MVGFCTPRCALMVSKNSAILPKGSKAHEADWRRSVSCGHDDIIYHKDSMAQFSVVCRRDSTSFSFKWRYKMYHGGNMKRE